MIYLPWFPNGDPYSPPTPSVYHRYYGDYYQTYDLYMTSLTKLGSVLARAINSPIVSLLGYDHVFVDAYVPYSMPSNANTPWIDKLYEFIKKWAALDENVLEIYLFGGSHPYGYFSGNQWVWVSSPHQIPPDKARFPGILREGEYLYSFDVEFPIQLVPNTGIHYLTPDGNEVHWVFEYIGKDGLWKPKYTVLENSVVYEYGGLPPQLDKNFDTLPDPRILGDTIFETLRKVKKSSGKTVQKTFVPGSFQGLKPSSCNRYLPRYDLLDEIHCNKRYFDALYQGNFATIERKAREEGITYYEAFLAYILNVPFSIAFETRSTWEYYSYLATVVLSRESADAQLPRYMIYTGGWFINPGISIWISTTGPTNPYYRLSNYRPFEHPPRGYIPDIRIINDILAGRLINIRFTNYNIWNPAPDELTFVILGDVVLPPAPPKRIYAFDLTGNMVLGKRADWSDGKVIETITQIGDGNEGSQKSIIGL